MLQVENRQLYVFFRRERNRLVQSRMNVAA
jgi:hypothetical protein